MRFLVLLCILHGIPSRVTGQCNSTNIEQCVQPLDKYNIHNDVLFPQLKRRQLQNLCDDYDTTEACLQPIKPSCNLYRKRHYEGLEQTYDFICGVGFEVYLENYYCWGNEELRTEVRGCNVTYQRDIRDTMLNAYTYTHLEINKRLCQHINDYVFCIKDMIKSKCNSSSADWQHEVNLKSLSPVLAEMNCTIGRPLLNAGEIAGIVIGCVVFLVLLILVIYYCTCNVDSYRKKQKLYLNEAKQKAKSNPTVRPAAPPQGLAVPSSGVPRVPTVPTAPLTSQNVHRGSPKRSSLRKNPSSGSGRLNLSFAEDLESVRSGQYNRDNTYQSLPSYTQALALDRSGISSGQSIQQEGSEDWEEEEARRRPDDVPRLF